SGAGACLDANFERFSPLYRAFAMAHRTTGNILSRSMASRTRHVELHTAAGLLDCPFAVALRTGSWLLDVSISAAIPANFSPSNVQSHYSAAYCGPEGNVHLVFEIAAQLGTLFNRSAAPATENVGKDVSKTAAPRR